jgi:hypothetical protein
VAWALVQNAAMINQTVITPTVAVTNPIASGNLYCGAVIYNSTETLNSITDDKSNTYNIKNTTTQTTDLVKISNFVLGNITNGPKTITFHFSAATDSAAVVAEFSGGLAASDPSDGSTGQQQTNVAAGANNVTTGTFVPTTNGDLILGGLCDPNTVTACTVGTSPNAFTNVNTASNSTNLAGLRLEYFVQTTAASIAATGGIAANGDDAVSNVVAFKPATGAATTVGWGFDPGLPTVLKRPTRRDAAPWNSISRVEEETPPSPWLNVGWEIQPPQPPHPRPEKFGATIGGDPGTEFTEIRWQNSGWEIQSVQPANPATTNLSRSNRLAASSFARGDDGTEFPQVQWFNAGGEIQPFQPPNPATTNISRNNRRWAALVNGDDASGDESATTNWRNFGFEIQSVQPPNPTTTNISLNNRRAATLAQGDGGFYQPIVPQVQVINWGFDAQPIQPPRFRLQRWASIVDGDDASGDETATVNWINSGWETQSVQPPKLRLQRWASFVNGDDASGEDSPLVNWFNVGGEVQHPQPPHPRRERSGAVAPLSNVESVFVPPVVTAPSLFDSVLPTLKIRWGNRAEAAGGDTQFVAFDMQPWQEPQSVQPPHPRRERSGSIQRGDDGIENIIPQVAIIYNWGFEPVFPPSKARPTYFSGAVAKGDDGIELTPINWLNSGSEIQSIQPPHRRPERSGALAKGDEGVENPYVFVASTVVQWGFDGVWPQPPHPRPERSGAIQRGDDGTENPFIFIAPPVISWGFDAQAVQPPRLRWERRGSGLGGKIGFTVPAQWFNYGWEIQPPQPPHPKPERNGAIMRGDDGTENPIPVILPPTIVNWGYDGVWPQPPRAPKIRQRGSGARGQSSFGILPNFVTWGGEVQCFQPPHPRPEKSGSIAKGDEGIENRFIFVPIQVINWGYDGVWPQPPHPRPEKSGSIQRGDEGIESTYIFVPPTIVLRGYEGVWPQPPHPRREKAGAIMPIEPGIESTYVFVPPTIVNWGFDGVYPQPPHPRPERGEAICGSVDFEFSDSFPWLTLFQEPPLRHLRWEKSGGIMPIEPGIEATYIFVQRRGVFYAKSTITSATGQTVISRAKTQTIVKGEPA